MKKQPILFVNAGMTRPKKQDTPVARENLYLNYGLLGLASILSKKGYPVKVVDGRFTDPVKFVEDLMKRELLDSSHPIFLSVPSSFALSWVGQFCRSLKFLYPGKRLVVGGRWVAGPDGRWLSRKIPEADLVVCGTAEKRIESLLLPSIWHKIPHTHISLNRDPEPAITDLPGLDFNVLENFHRYHPSIEISRGCGMGCAFCVENDSPLSWLRSPVSTVNSLVHICNTYNTEFIHAYFESSCFRPSRYWAAEFDHLYHEYGLSATWRAETRVDGLMPKTLKHLASAGLKVIDLGLESASPIQLMRMKKCADPKKYLKKASELLQECKKLGVWVKVNVLLYGGESRETIEETAAWLSLHRHCIKGVSVGALTIYGPDERSHLFLRSLAPMGTKAVDPFSLEQRGYSHLHLSNSIDFEASIETALALSKEFMTEEDYFDLKSFGYFPRGFSYEQFRLLVNSSPTEILPFQVTSLKEEAALWDSKFGRPDVSPQTRY